MQKYYKFIAERIYPSDKGLHLEFGTKAEAKAFYEDGFNRGITNSELYELTLIKRFKTAQKRILTGEINDRS